MRKHASSGGPARPECVRALSNSVNTNIGALAALRSLNGTAADLAVVRRRIGTGLRVASARDNGAAWSIAQAQRSDVRGFDTVLASLNRGRGVVDTALAGGQTVADLLSQMKEKALAASDTALDAQTRAALNDDFKALRDQIATVVRSAEFGGVNVLKSGAVAAEYLAGLRLVTTGVVNGGGGNGNGNAGGNGNGNGNAGGNGNGNGNGGGGGLSTAPTRLTVVAEVMALGGPNVTVTANASFSSATEAAALADQVQASLKRVVLAVARLGTAAARFDAQVAFVTKTQAALDAGVGALVDADLAREAARLEALQTRERLGIEALAIANRTPGMLLRLFQGPVTAT